MTLAFILPFQNSTHPLLDGFWQPNSYASQLKNPEKSQDCAQDIEQGSSLENAT